MAELHESLECNSRRWSTDQRLPGVRDGGWKGDNYSYRAGGLFVVVAQISRVIRLHGNTQMR